MAVCQKGANDNAHQCWRPNKTTQNTEYKCNKNLPNPVSTVINTHTVISQYLFTSADKMK